MPLRVLHVLPHRGGGGEVYVDMLTRMPDVAHERLYLSTGRTPASAAVSVPYRWVDLARRLRGADLIHVHGDAAAIIASPVLGVRPSVITTHGLHLWRRSTGLRRLLITRLLTSAVGRSRAIVCTSATERAELTPIVGAQQIPKLKVIYNGVDRPDKLSTSQRDQVRGELRVGPESVLALFVGQLEPRKAPLVAARAARRVYEHCGSFVLAVAGDGSEAGAVQALAGPAVKVLGYRDDIPKLMAACDVFVQPSEREGLSFGLLEAMANGLAVVAADGPGNPEAVGDAGLLFPARDEDALMRALVSLCADAEKRRELGRAARERALLEFPAERFVEESHSLYREITLSTTSANAAAGAGYT